MPHAILVTKANISDKAGAKEMIKSSAIILSEVQNLLVDGGYLGKPFAEYVETTIGAKVQVAKRNELNKFDVIPQRWIVERSFGWLDKCRRLWKNCERKLNTSTQMIIVRFIELILKRF